MILSNFGSICQNLGNRAEVGQNQDACKAISATLSVLKWSGAIFRPRSWKVIVKKVMLCAFHCKPRPSRVMVESGESKLTPNGLGLQWNAQSITFLTITLQLLGRNIAPLHFKTERVAEIALQASWFWPTSARFPGTWPIFSSPGDFELTPDGLCLELNAQSVTF